MRSGLCRSGFIEGFFLVSNKLKSAAVRLVSCVLKLLCALQTISESYSATWEVLVRNGFRRGVGQSVSRQRDCSQGKTHRKGSKRKKRMVVLCM